MRCGAAWHVSDTFGRISFTAPFAGAVELALIHDWCARPASWAHVEPRRGAWLFFCDDEFYVLAQQVWPLPSALSSMRSPDEPWHSGVDTASCSFTKTCERPLGQSRVCALATVWISNFGRSFMKPYSFDLPSLYEQECAGNAGRENNDRPH